MKTAFFICLIFAVSAYAKPTLKTSKPPFDIDAELSNLTCMTKRDIEQLWGGCIKYGTAYFMSRMALRKSTSLIGIEEMRRSLGLPPPGPWKHYNSTKPSDEELDNASTMEEYYNLKEPTDKERSLDSEDYFESNFPPMIALLDSRFASIRNSFRKRFEEMVRVKSIGRREINLMISEFHDIVRTVSIAIDKRMIGHNCIIISPGYLF